MKISKFCVMAFGLLVFTNAFGQETPRQKTILKGMWVISGLGGTVVIHDVTSMNVADKEYKLIDARQSHVNALRQWEHVKGNAPKTTIFEMGPALERSVLEGNTKIALERIADKEERIKTLNKAKEVYKMRPKLAKVVEKAEETIERNLIADRANLQIYTDQLKSLNPGESEIKLKALRAEVARDHTAAFVYLPDSNQVERIVSQKLEASAIDTLERSMVAYTANQYPNFKYQTVESTLARNKINHEYAVKEFETETKLANSANEVAIHDLSKAERSLKVGKGLKWLADYGIPIAVVATIADKIWNVHQKLDGQDPRKSGQLVKLGVARSEEMAEQSNVQPIQLARP